MARLDFRIPLRPARSPELIRQGILQNARFAAAVLVRGIQRGPKEDVHVLIRSDVLFPSLYTIRRQGLFTTPVALRHRACCRSICEKFPARANPASSRRKLYRRNSPRNPCRRPLARTQNPAQSHDPEEHFRRRRALAAIIGSRVKYFCSRRARLSSRRCPSFRYLATSQLHCVSLRPRFKHHIEWRLRRSAESRESA